MRAALLLVLVGGLLIIPALMETGVIGVRVGIIVALLAVAAAFGDSWRSSRRLESFRSLRAVSLWVTVVAALGVGAGLPDGRVAQGLVSLMLASAAFLAIARNLDGRPPIIRRQFGGTVWVTLLIVLLASAWIVAGGLMVGTRPLLIDELVYLIQSQHVLTHPHGFPIPDGLDRHFALRLGFERDGQWVGQFPPGWPMVLALIRTVMPGWAGLLVVYASAVAATYWLARTIASHRVGLVAAALLGLNPYFLSLSTTYYPHVFGMTVSLLVATSLVYGSRAERLSWRLAWVSAAGVSIGFLCSMRPLTGLAMGAAVGLWALVWARPRGATLWSGAAALVVGVAGPIGWLLHYNASTTGNPLVFGYDVAHGGLHSLGFGVRGWLAYDANGRLIQDVATFTPLVAVDHLLQSAYQALHAFWPACAILPIIYLAVRSGHRIRWGAIVPFAVLPTAYFFYFYQDLRFYSELLPFAMVGTAFLVRAIHQQRAPLSSAVVALLLCLFMPAVLSSAKSRRNGRDGLHHSLASLDSLRREYGQVLLLVRDQASLGRAIPFEVLYRFNLGEFPGDVIVARDLGEANTALERTFPGYQPIIAQWGGCSEGQRKWCYAFEPLEGPRARPVDTARQLPTPSGEEDQATLGP